MKYFHTKPENLGEIVNKASIVKQVVLNTKSCTYFRWCLYGRL